MSNKDINIIFFGNTDFSNPTLLACNNSFNLKAVVTNKSKKMGRGQKILDTPVMTLAKKENLKIGKEKEKLQRSLGGIAEMKKTPDLIFIIDTNIESLAVAEAKKLGIPIIGILDW